MICFAVSHGDGHDKSTRASRITGTNRLEANIGLLLARMRLFLGYYGESV